MDHHKAILKQHNLKVTNARVTILDFLNEQTIPVDIASITTYLKQKSIATDDATVFRIMNTYKKQGIVKQIQLQEGKSRYELASRPEHHHIVCTRCGDIEDINVCINTAIEQKVTDETGYAISSHSMEFQGLCPDCTK